MAICPIIFSAPMVRALLAGTKTQTRRILKLPTTELSGDWQISTVGGQGVTDVSGNPAPERPCLWHPRSGKVVSRAYAVGDLLWVRETCRTYEPADHRSERVVRYKADGNMGLLPEANGTWDSKARPSIHMPRWASRLTLEVTGVKVERLNDISEDDALAEGIRPIPVTIGLDGQPSGWNRASIDMDDHAYNARTARECFAYLWHSINGDPRDDWETPLEAPAWVDNPWVVAVSFIVHRQNVDALAPQRAAAE